MSTKITSVDRLGFPWATQDPFLFCAHHRDEYPKGSENFGVASALLAGRNVGSDFVLKDGWRMYHGSSMPGFPYHPHRGFETITINKEGVVDHSDSLGAAGRFMEGDVQWMTAGKGVQHSEMFPLIYKDKPNPLEIFQVWLNLPKASKMVAPHFKMLWKEELPKLSIEDAANKYSEIDVIAGKWGELAENFSSTPDSWAAKKEHGVGVFTIKMEEGATLRVPPTIAEAHRTIYFYRGRRIKVEGREVAVNYSISVKANEELTIENGDQEAFMLILEGKPIGEPVAQHGPFVMNTPEEINQAFRDYQATQFGGWPWPKQEQFHGGPETGRFALHADGTKEER